MKTILLISDTHGYLDAQIINLAQNCDEIWHAGDIGNEKTLYKLEKIKPLKAVYGNIDGADIRKTCKGFLLFNEQGLKIFIAHILGYPCNYNPYAKRMIQQEKPDIVITGHSHILKIIWDKQNNHLHLNPGAAGNHGFHKVKTALRIQLDSGKIKQIEVIELGNRTTIEEKSLFD